MCYNRQLKNNFETNCTPYLWDLQHQGFKITQMQQKNACCRWQTCQGWGIYFAKTWTGEELYVNTWMKDDVRNLKSWMYLPCHLLWAEVKVIPQIMWVETAQKVMGQSQINQRTTTILVSHEYLGHTFSGIFCVVIINFYHCSKCPISNKHLFYLFDTLWVPVFSANSW